MDNNFGAGFARAICGFVSRAVIDDQNVVESLTRSAHDFADVPFFVVSGNDRRSS